MTDTKQSLQRLEEIAEHYIRELDRYDLEQLTRQPNEQEWSLGQMYVHLINSALFMQLRHVETCQNQFEPGARHAAEKTAEGAAVFALGGFPPIKIQVPASAAYTPPQPESKEQLIDGIRQVIRRMVELEPALDAVPEEHKVPHPRLGALNAKEWFALVGMHFRHHLLQKERLDAFLEQGK
ncbi:DinB family protein [Paenibacillus sp. MBLB4367]|uniref:DinB family protein n=1 Tax=Paenibacillus sp. MBLB4367 TaxID=3384767 RepID=UPI00390837D6